MKKSNLIALIMIFYHNANAQTNQAFLLISTEFLLSVIFLLFIVILVYVINFKYKKKKLIVSSEKKKKNRLDREEPIDNMPDKQDPIANHSQKYIESNNQFMKKVYEIIDHNIADTSFSVEILAQKLYLGRTQLFRKIKTNTNESPNEVIRNYRLDKGMDLLKSKKGNVIEVSRMVGMNEKYFSTRFKEKFGVSPSEVNN